MTRVANTCNPEYCTCYLWDKYEAWAYAEVQTGPVLSHPCNPGSANDACAGINNNAHSWGKCSTCGYVMHDIPQEPSDTAHDELCGQEV